MGIKQAIRNWLFPWQEDHTQGLRARMLDQSESVARLADIIRADMYRDLSKMRSGLLEEMEHIVAARRAIQQRAPKLMWRKFDREACGPDYGRIASAASTSPYAAWPAVIGTGQVQMALPSSVVEPHAERGFVAMQHIPMHPHHKLPAFDFGETEAQALFNLSQQMAQIALHEGWTLTYPEN